MSVTTSLLESPQVSVDETLFLPPKRHSEKSLEKRCKQVVIVGHYCHDSLSWFDGKRVETLGGSAAFIAPLLKLLELQPFVVSKVGSDFKYSSDVVYPPIVLQENATTEFFAHWKRDGKRLLRAGNICSSIDSNDLEFGEGQVFDIGLVVGVAGEILPSTLKRLAQISSCTVVDLQALIRVINPCTGEVKLQKMEHTPFFNLLPLVSYLKASRCEAEYFDPERCAQICKAVIVTDGPSGCTVFTRNGDFQVAAFPCTEVDATGAGDTFLGAFAAGLSQGLDLYSATLMGNYFGSLAVSQIGVPIITKADVQGWEQIRLGQTKRDCFVNIA